jgi:S1-C subfamily serine protease
MNRGLGIVALLALGIALGIGWREWAPRADGAPPAAPVAGATERDVAVRGGLDAEELATIGLFERTRDSVVFISTRARVQNPWTRNVFQVPQGSGSGFIWDDAGHVVTNFHVIRGASGATVRLADGRDYEAALVGVSPAHDIAVLRIGLDFEAPPPVPLGSSGSLRVGQKVFAIGNPFGLDWSLTTGIVSALDRSLPSDSGVTIEHLIQTDAAINPGNSGGPLLDSAGRLVGINTAIYSPSGASAGIGFAVPVDTVNRVVPQLIRTGRYERPTLGVQVDEAANAQLRRALGIEGVVVLGVTPGSGADRAGLEGLRSVPGRRVEPRDIITAIDGEKVATVGRLLGRLDDYRPGDTVTLTVRRDGRDRRVPVRLGGGS